MTPPREPGLVRLLVGDGRPLLAVTGLALLGSGLFALFLATRSEFLPHDLAYLGQSADQLCGVNQCRVVHFMIHDRAAFGGALAAVGIMYLWLIAGPLATGERWAWHTLLASGLVGFASFLTYLSTGYLDTWHGVAGMAITRRTLRPAEPVSLRRRFAGLGVGRMLLLASAGGMTAAGCTIAGFGMTRVFVPEDLVFLGTDRAALDLLNPRLVPLIAHDRAGFGGAVACCGVTLWGVAWHARPSLALWQAVAVCGLLGFGPAIGVHFAVGYTDPWHLAPAVGGAVTYFGGVIGCVRSVRPAS